jgi:hypothetical protein
MFRSFIERIPPHPHLCSSTFSTGAALAGASAGAFSVQGSIDMMSKRVGKWAWALSGEERVAAAIVGVAQSEKSEISAKLKRKYEAMLEKQRKLTAS